MDIRLKHLIKSYNERVYKAVQLLHLSGIDLPISSFQWLNNKIPISGQLLNNAIYIKHGYGCKLIVDTTEIDFDFGQKGEIDGFDLFRIINYFKNNHEKYNFENEKQIEDSYDAALKSGELFASPYILCYVPESKRTLAIEVNRNIPDDLLPYREQDEISILDSEYFQISKLNLKNYELIVKKSAKRELSRTDQIKMRAYLSTWLAFLAATCEAFDTLEIRTLIIKRRPASFAELKILCDNIGKMLKPYKNDLRLYRNNIFHIRKDIKPILNFHLDSEDRLIWAMKLYKMWEEFFSAYRICCEVHYLMQNRSKESIFSQT